MEVIFKVWKEEYCIGVAHIDQQHKQLFEAVDHWLKAIEMGASKAEFEAVLAFLKDYVVTHFNDEEAYMLEIDYVDFELHLKTHTAFSQTVLSYERILNACDYSLPACKQLGGVLVSWLTYHVTGEDQFFATNKPIDGMSGMIKDIVLAFGENALKVLKTMVKISLDDATTEIVRSAPKGDLCIGVEFKGALQGQVVFGFSHEFAENFVANLTRTSVATIEDLVYSALAECSNIVCGNAATTLSKQDRLVDISTPKAYDCTNLKQINGVRVTTKIGEFFVWTQLKRT